LYELGNRTVNCSGRVTVWVIVVFMKQGKTEYLVKWQDWDSK